MSLEHIKYHHVTSIANKTNSSRNYVNKILSGERSANTLKAKVILMAAQKLNAAIEKAQPEMNKEFEKLTDND
jgi:hypothetical protein